MYKPNFKKNKKKSKIKKIYTYYIDIGIYLFDFLLFSFTLIEIQETGHTTSAS